MHDITNVLPNAPSPSLALAEETSALRLTEVLSRRTLGPIHNTRSNTTNYSNLNYVLRQTGFLGGHVLGSGDPAVAAPASDPGIV